MEDCCKMEPERKERRNPPRSGVPRNKALQAQVSQGGEGMPSFCFGEAYQISHKGVISRADNELFPGLHASRAVLVKLTSLG